MRVSTFRGVAGLLIAFNLLGTLLTWSDHLVKPGTSHAHAIGAGTEFTGPLAYVALWIVFVLLTLRPGRARIAGVILMSLAALTYAIGQVTELTKSHIVGLSTHKFHLVIALTWVGLALAVATVVSGCAVFYNSRGLRTPESLPAQG